MREETEIEVLIISTSPKCPNQFKANSLFYCNAANEKCETDLLIYSVNSRDRKEPCLIFLGGIKQYI
jgi:hypothetical protein